MYSIKKETFGKNENGQVVHLFTLSNTNSMEVSITNYGGIITKILVPDSNGNMSDVVLGFDTLEEYLNNNFYFGAIIGRYANRIANGKFTLNCSNYSLPINNGTNHLHGGNKGFDRVVWTPTVINKENNIGLELTYVSRDGEEGYPGELHVTVTYLLTNDNELSIEYNATTDKPTICNLTDHTYFNLCNGGRSNIFDHLVMINGDAITLIDENKIPTGEILSVKGTPFDFRKCETIRARIDKSYKHLKDEPYGYDHNYVLNGKAGEMNKAAVVKELTTGRILEVFTREPGIQFYSGNYLDGTVAGKNGIRYNIHSGFCLETQHFPDSPNQPNFPSTTLNPGENYQTATVYKFSILQ